MSLELELIRSYRRLIEHLGGKHNQKSHANKYGSADAVKGNVKRLGGDKQALKRMATKVRGDKEFQGKVKAGAEEKKAARNPANKIVASSSISKLNIDDNSKLMGSNKTFADVKKDFTDAVNVVVKAAPQVKASGANMKDASFEAEDIFRSALRKRVGSGQLNFITTRDGKQAIVGISDNSINDISEKVRQFVANY